MKRYWIVVISCIALFSCSKDYLVLDDLDSDDVRYLIGIDTLYEKLILECEFIKKEIDDNIVLKSKFAKLSFDNYFQYKKITLDSSFINTISQKADSIRKSSEEALFKKYEAKIDSQITEYMQRQYELSPDSYFKVEFDSISKEYYSSLNSVKEVLIHFKITPMKGPIDGGSFLYSVIPKVTGKAAASGNCRFSRGTTEPKVYRWETPYDVKDEFESLNTIDVNNRYTFEYIILTARYNDKTYGLTDANDLIPLEFRVVLDSDTLTENSYHYLINSYYGEKGENVWDIFNDHYSKAKRQIDKLSYEFEQIAAEYILEDALDSMLD